MMIRSTKAQHERRFFLYDVPVTNIKVVFGQENVNKQQRITALTKLSAVFSPNKQQELH
jgi:hypothetical protein